MEENRRSLEVLMTKAQKIEARTRIVPTKQSTTSKETKSGLAHQPLS